MLGVTLSYYHAECYIFMFQLKETNIHKKADISKKVAKKVQMCRK